MRPHKYSAADEVLLAEGALLGLSTQPARERATKSFTTAAHRNLQLLEQHVK